jgi:LPXTG-site transpeptidase (sortase) family protein
MRLNYFSKYFIFAVSVAGIIFFSIFFLFLTLTLPVQAYYSKPILLANNNNQRLQSVFFSGLVNPGIPVRLKIPKINVDANIESVGLTSKGAVGVPKGLYSVAWFNRGPRPGDIGNAVITGHYGIWKNGTATVFNNLSKLKKGDKLYVKDEKGVSTTFVVREIRTYDPKAVAFDVFTSNDEKSHLNIITCGGAWNKATKSYPKRLVVFTDREV